MAPANEDELADMMFTAIPSKSPDLYSLPRGAAEGVPVKDQPKLLEVGKAEVGQNLHRTTGKKKVATFCRIGQYEFDGAQSSGATGQRRV